IRIWSLATGEQPCVMEGHTSTVYSIDYAPDGQTVASASDDSTVRIWDTTTGQELRKLEDHNGIVRYVTFIPLGKQLASSGSDHTLRIWDWAEGKELRRIEAKFNSSLDVSRDGKTLVGNAGGVRLW